MTLSTLPSTTITPQRGRRAVALLALLGCLAGTGGCQVLYDVKLADSLRDCDKLAMQSAVSECRGKLQAQQDAFRRAQQAQAKADKAAAPPAR